jgi:hypothetical protein
MHHPNLAAHAQHDLDLVAGHAAGDLTDTDRLRADALLASCATCAELRRDLIDLAAATRTLSSIATAPRDFRLSAEQAARLRRPGFVTRLLRPFAGARSGVRPVAMAFTSLGLAGLLVANILPGLFGSAALESRDSALGAPQPSAAAGAGGSSGQVPAAQPPSATDDRVQVQGAGQPSQPADKNNEFTTGQASTPPRVAAGAPGQSGATDLQRLTALEREQVIARTNPIFAVSLVLLLVGLALFGLRFAARRVR